MPGARVGAVEAKSVGGLRGWGGSINSPRAAGVGWGEQSEEAHACPCSQGGGTEKQDPF